MPKVSPDQVIRHEIVFGRADRELLESAIMAYQFNRVATPLVAGLSDVTFVGTMVIIWAYLTGREAPRDDSQNVIEWLWNDWNAYRTTEEYQEKYAERSTSFLGGVMNLFENLISGFGKSAEDVKL